MFWGELMVIWKGWFETVPCRATLNTPFSTLCPRILGTRFTSYGLQVSGLSWKLKKKNKWRKKTHKQNIHGIVPGFWGGFCLCVFSPTTLKTFSSPSQEIKEILTINGDFWYWLYVMDPKLVRIRSSLIDQWGKGLQGRKDTEKTHINIFFWHPPSPWTIPQICLCLYFFANLVFCLPLRQNVALNWGKSAIFGQKKHDQFWSCFASFLFAFLLPQNDQKMLSLPFKKGKEGAENEASAVFFFPWLRPFWPTMLFAGTNTAEGRGP